MQYDLDFTNNYTQLNLCSGNNALPCTSDFFNMRRSSFKMLNFAVCFAGLTLVLCSVKKYTPDWDSLDSRPLPTWYDGAKFGIFIHWGVFSVPSYSMTAWLWAYWKGWDNNKPVDDVVKFMERNYPPDFTYADFAKDFTAEFYDPDEWVDIFKAAGAQYVVFVSKHAEGFANWPSNYSFNWNSKDVGPNRDIVGDLAKAIRKKTDIKFGLYYCISEWFHPLYMKDKAGNWSTDDFVMTKALPMLYELVNQYSPEIVWSDLAAGVGPASYYKSKEFLAWLYNESRVKNTVVTNDRWCEECPCKHGGYHTCQDEYNPGVLQNHKWENCMKIDRYAWGYRRTARLGELLSIHEIISNFASTISCGGNLLLNIGPTKDGKIVPIFEERLRQFGIWLKVNGEGIYNTTPWSYQKENDSLLIWYIMKKTNNEGTVVYAIMLSWPINSVLILKKPIASQNTKITILGYPENIYWISRASGKGIVISVPIIPINRMPCDWAWVWKMTFIQN